MAQVNPGRATTSDTEGAGEVKEANAFTQLLNEFNGSIDDANIKSGAAISAAKLAAGTITDAQLSATYSGYAMYREVLSGAQPSLTASTTVVRIITTSTFHIDPADYAASGRTTKYRVRASLNVNQVAPGITITFGLYPVSVSAYGGSGAANSYAVGGVVAGSTVAFASPSGSSMNQNASADFTAPAAGYYTLGYVGSGSSAAGSLMDVGARLQVRQT